MKTDSSHHQFEELLQKFRRLPGNGKTPAKTFLEISDFPRSELAMSNILAFFIDPNEEHGFHDLFLRSLLQWISPKLPSHDLLNCVEVIREDRTDNNKRIDIVIDAPSFVIGIENKIDADDNYNPYEDYGKRIMQRAGGREFRCVLLSRKGDRRPGCATLQKFQTLSYDDLFASVQQNLGPAILQAQHAHIVFLLDFINTVKNFEKGIRMDKQTLDFFKFHEANAVKFYLSTQNLLKQIREKAEAVKKNLKKSSSFQKPWFWSFANDPDSTGFWDVIVSRAALPDGSQISVDASLELNKGWTIYIWNPPKNAKIKAISTWLAERGIVPKVPSDEGDWYWEEFDFNANPEDVAHSYQELISEIEKRLANP